MDGAIAHAGQQNRYTFDLASPARLYFDGLTDPSQIPNLTWSLVGPRGEEVGTQYFSSSDGYLSINPPLDVPAGSYALVVDAYGDQTGTYSFRLLDAATATPIASGTPVPGQLPTGKETALYRFDAQVGERFFFDQQSQTGSGNVYWRLIDPFGKQVWVNGFADQDVQTLAFSGTYTLSIEGYVYNASPVDFSFAVQKVEDTTAPLTVGATMDGAIAHAGQQNRYTFDLASPARLYFD
ncbi:hypothetical protein, partial [Mesorhizobium sp. LNHC229A00]|uniref:hypothetical protein n=1 Tax=Mesorhizobium sp. LNHC229A00 TaxID=1287240 RepID=UPI000517F585